MKRRKSEINLSSDIYMRFKQERLAAVTNGKWRTKKGNILDLNDKTQVSDKYLEVIISSSAEREKIDRTGLDEKITNKLLEIRKNRKKTMNVEQIEMKEIVGTQHHNNRSNAVEAAKTAAVIMPRMFNAKDIVGKFEVLGFEPSNKGPKKGWVYTVRHLKTGKITKIKQYDLSQYTVHFKTPTEPQENQFFKYEEEPKAQTKVEKKHKKPTSTKAKANENINHTSPAIEVKASNPVDIADEIKKMSFFQKVKMLFV